jgi:serine protease
VRAVKEVEPNGKLAIAQRVVAPVRIDASLASKVDTDYYSVVIGAGQTIEASLVCNTSSDYDLNAYNSAGKLIASSRMGSGEVDSVTLTNSSGTKAVTAYVRVVYYSGGTGTKAGRYSLTLK